MKVSKTVWLIEQALDVNNKDSICWDLRLHKHTCYYLHILSWNNDKTAKFGQHFTWLPKMSGMSEFWIVRNDYVHSKETLHFAEGFNNSESIDWIVFLLFWGRNGIIDTIYTHIDIILTHDNMTPKQCFHLH